jgi:hypothetical protein
MKRYLRLMFKPLTMLFFAVFNLIFFAVGVWMCIRFLIASDTGPFLIAFGILGGYSCSVQWVWYFWTKDMDYRDDGWDGDKSDKYPMPPFPLDRCSFPRSRE